MPRLLTTLGCLLALCAPASAEEIVVPRLPEGTTVYDNGWCSDPITGARMVCLILKHEQDIYTKYRDPYFGEVQRITRSSDGNYPETIWVRHGDDTF